MYVHRSCSWPCSPGPGNVSSGSLSTRTSILKPYPLPSGLRLRERLRLRLRDTLRLGLHLPADTRPREGVRRRPEPNPTLCTSVVQTHPTVHGVSLTTLQNQACKKRTETDCLSSAARPRPSASARSARSLAASLLCAMGGQSSPCRCHPAEEPQPGSSKQGSCLLPARWCGTRRACARPLTAYRLRM